MAHALLRTERLELRAITDGDIDRILEYRNLPEVNRWLLRTEVEPESFREHWRQAVADPDDHSVAVTLDGLVIGTILLSLTDGMGQPGMPSRTEGEIGYIFDPAHAGQGYAFEAASAMLAYAFGSLAVRRVTAGCFAGNEPSVRILEKLGMRREQHGVGDSWHAELGWVDGYSYAILAGEWHGQEVTRPATR